MMSICVEVVEYCCVGDDNYYKNHTFGIRIWSEQEHLHYSVQRDYLSFCGLHARLTKKFTKTEFPTFPLEGYNAFVKKANKNTSSTATKLMQTFQKSSTDTSNKNESSSSSSSSSSKSNTNIRNSISSSVTDNSSVGDLKITSKGNEVITQKKSALTNYLRQLLATPEIIICEDIKVFFDEEAPDGSSIQRRALTDIEAALIGEEANIVTVSREHKITITGKRNDVIVWSFATKKRDIGFSVQFVDSQKTALPYQRYDSHTQTISGCLELVDAGQIELLWDNAYAKFHSKVLTYMCKVLNKSEYEVCQRIAYERGRDRHRFEQQRVVLRRVLSLALKELQSAQGGGGLLKTSASTNREAVEFSSLEESMVQLREELLSVQAQLTERETMLVDERSNASNLADRFKEEEELRRNVESDLLTSQQTVEELQQRVDNYMRENDLARAECDRLKILSEHSSDRLKAMEANLNMKTQNIIDLTNQISKIKTEKKQLKAYALKLKAENEEIESSMLNTTENLNDSVLRDKVTKVEEGEQEQITIDNDTTTNQVIETDEQEKEMVTESDEQNQQEKKGATTNIDNNISLVKDSNKVNQPKVITAVGWEVPREEVTNPNQEEQLNDDSEGEQDALCAQILEAEYGQRLLYLHNSVGF